MNSYHKLILYVCFLSNIVCLMDEICLFIYKQVYISEIMYFWSILAFQGFWKTILVILSIYPLFDLIFFLLGIVRGMDVKKGILYLITPVSLCKLEKVDILLQGFIEIPTSLLQVFLAYEGYLFNGCLSNFWKTNCLICKNLFHRQFFF